MLRFNDLACLIFVSSALSFAQSDLGDFIAIDFHDDNRGWIAAREGRIFFSADAGLTWTERSRIGHLLSGFDFINENTGYALTPTGLLVTRDGGDVWRTKLANFQHYCSRGALENVAGFSNKIALVHNSFCIIEPGLYNGAILLADTANIAATTEPVFHQQGGLFDLAVVRESRMWAVGRQLDGVSRTFHGAIYSDSSAVDAQWRLQYLDSEQDRTFYAISFVDSILGWACGDSGLILHTRDGENWRAQTTPLQRNLFDIAFADSRVGWAVGNYGTILHTLNGGETWSAQTSGVSVTLNGIAALSADTACVVGNDSTILITVDGGITWQPRSVRTFIALDENFVPLQFVLDQNHPNPFNPSTTISFSLPRASFVTLKIYNLLGEEVATLVHERREAGEHRVHWQPHDLPSGVYVYRLQTGGYVHNRKLVLIR